MAKIKKMKVKIPKTSKPPKHQENSHVVLTKAAHAKGGTKSV